MKMKNKKSVSLNPYIRKYIKAMSALTIIFLITGAVYAQNATIKIDILRPVGEIERNIYGVFMEPIMNSMDGLLYDPEHPRLPASFRGAGMDRHTNHPFSTCTNCFPQT
jgi:hypothetical protein